MEFLESCVFQWPNICVDEKANNVEKAYYVLRGSNKKKTHPCTCGRRIKTLLILGELRFVPETAACFDCSTISGSVSES